MVLHQNLTTAPKPFVFVLMPFANEFGDIYKYGIKGAAEEIGAYAERIDEQMFTEGILDRIFNQISKADVIVADMTGQNPNVFYEVGYAHALGKTVLLITQNASDIPFDLKHRPHVIYNGKIEQLRQQLAPKLLWALTNESCTSEKLNATINFPLPEEIEVSSEVLGKLTTHKQLNIAEHIRSTNIFPNKLIVFKPEGQSSLKKFPVMVSSDLSGFKLIEPRIHSVWGMEVDTTDKAIISSLLKEPTIQIVNLICAYGDEAIRFSLAHALDLVFEHKEYLNCWITQASKASIDGVPVNQYISRGKEIRSSWALYLDDVIDDCVEGNCGPESGEWGKAAVTDLIRSKIKIYNFAELAQRRITRTFVIVQDAQNLSRQQLRSLVMGVSRTSKLVLISKILPPSEFSSEVALTGVVQMTNNLTGKPEFAHYVYPEDANSDGLRLLASEI